MIKLNVNELTLEQKIGMVLMGTAGYPCFDKNFESSIERIKNHALGTVWVAASDDGSHKKYLNKIREVADYPVLVIMDAESGYMKHKIGSQIALGYIDDLEATYEFARALGAEARADGYSGICGPIIDPAELDSLCPTRKFALDKYGITRHAEAFIKGFHDAGILSITKHYPSLDSKCDTHLFEGQCNLTREEVINDHLYPYIELQKKGLLDGIMTGHSVVKNIDADNPASISKKLIDIIRGYGFEGISITDDLSMLGICAKYGEDRFFRSVEAGNDIVLDFTLFESEKSIKKALDDGKLTEEQITVAAKRVIDAQNKTLELGSYKFSERDVEAIDRINRRSIVEVTDENVEKSISKDGRHLFIIMTNKPTEFDGTDDAYENEQWYRPKMLAKHILEKFPNSGVVGISEYPDKHEMIRATHAALDYDDTVLVYFSEWQCYVGGECFTSRIIKLAESLVAAKRAHTLVYFGSPNILRQLPHFERIIAGCNHFDNNCYCIDVLAGDLIADGKFTYDVDLRKE